MTSLVSSLTRIIPCIWREDGETPEIVSVHWTVLDGAREVCTGRLPKEGDTWPPISRRKMNAAKADHFGPPELVMDVVLGHLFASHPTKGWQFGECLPKRSSQREDTPKEVTLHLEVTYYYAHHWVQLSQSLISYCQ